MRTLEEFKSARNTALLSLDEFIIRDFFEKFNNHKLPDDPEIFWGSIHKAITGCTDLPFEFRKESKAYLDAKGLRSLDDGDL